MAGAGAKFGRYELVEPLGAGGMGIVWRARDTRLDREVAVKVLDERRLASARAVARFGQEARLAGALNHPNVLVVFDAGEHEGAPFLVTELLDGQTLRQRLAAGALPWREALALCAQAAEGLAAAHARGIVHRDLKPENLFLTREGRVKILDFGVAKLLEGPDADDAAGEASPIRTVTAEGNPITSTGAPLGTPAYMSPEQVHGQAADARSDVFAFGCVLHELLAGQRPFGGRTPGEIGAAILGSPPRLLPGGVPPRLAKLVARCLEKQPPLRYPDGAGLLAALREVERTEAAARERTPRRFGTAPILAGAAGLVLGTAGVWAVARRQPPSAQAAVSAAAAAAAPAPALPSPASPAQAPQPAAPVPAGASAAATTRPALRPPPVLRPQPAPPIARQSPRAQSAPQLAAARAVPAAAAAAPPSSAPAPDPAPAKADAADPGVAQVDQLLRARRLKDAIGEAQALLARNPPRELERRLLQRLAQASYDDGDDDGALRYSLRYRPLCPPAELPALDKRIARLRSNLGLAGEVQ